MAGEASVFEGLEAHVKADAAVSCSVDCDPLCPDVSAALRRLATCADVLAACELRLSGSVVTSDTDDLLAGIAVDTLGARDVVREAGRIFAKAAAGLRQAVTDQMLLVLPYAGEKADRAWQPLAHDAPALSPPPPPPQQRLQPPRATPSEGGGSSVPAVKPAARRHAQAVGGDGRRQPSLDQPSLLAAYAFVHMKSLAHYSHAASCSLWLLVDAVDMGKKQSLLKCASVYPSTSHMHHRTLSPTGGVGGTVIQAMVALNISEVGSSSLYTLDTQQALGEVTSLLCFPVYSSLGVCCGVVFLAHTDGDRFSEADESALLEGAELLSGVLGQHPLAHFFHRIEAELLDASRALKRDDYIPGAGAQAVKDLMTDVVGKRRKQLIYRTGSAALITGKERITAKAVAVDGQNLCDLAQQLVWMDQMWRCSLNENSTLSAECRWWQGRLAEAQARVRWMQRQAERAQRCTQLSEVRLVLTGIPPEGDVPPPRPAQGRVRSYAAVKMGDYNDMRQKMQASFGLPTEDKGCQTEKPAAGAASGAGPGWNQVQQTWKLRRCSTARDDGSRALTVRSVASRAGQRASANASATPTASPRMPGSPSGPRPVLRAPRHMTRPEPGLHKKGSTHLGAEGTHTTVSLSAAHYRQGGSSASSEPPSPCAAAAAADEDMAATQGRLLLPQELATDCAVPSFHHLHH